MVDITEFCTGFDYQSDSRANSLGSKEIYCFTKESIESSYAELRTGLNVFFLLAMGTLVYFMQAGFAMLCAGSVRQKNVKNILFKNLLDACGGAIGFWTLGYAFAYGEGPLYIGLTNFCLMGINSGSDLVFFFFQFAFAATAATIVAGTIAERCRMIAYLCYSIFLTAFVYPIVVRAIWSSYGFFSAFKSESLLFGTGMIDFAGSGVVHMTGGMTALVAAIILGPRKGRFYELDGKTPLENPVSFPPHSVALQMFGTFILWFGWYGFNPGSALAIDTKGYSDVAALSAVTTTIGAASGAVSSVFTKTLLDHYQTGLIEYDLSYAMNGALSGLVAITANCSVVTPVMAFLIGVIAGWVFIAFSKLLLKLKIDDAVDAIPVHLANGIWGCIATGLFAHPDKVAIAYGSPAIGLFYSKSYQEAGNGNLLGAELCGVGFIIVWVSVIMIPFFLILRLLGLFRIEGLEEEVGLDISHHKGSAYDLQIIPKGEFIEKKTFHGISSRQTSNLGSPYISLRSCSMEKVKANISSKGNIDLASTNLSEVKEAL